MEILLTSTQISLASKTTKHDPTYHLTVSPPSPSSSPTSPPISVSAPFTTWFTSDGYFVAKPFQQWLASSVEAIGNADAKNAMRDQRDELAAPTAEVERVVEANGTGDAMATGVEGKGRGKKSKRKG